MAASTLSDEIMPRVALAGFYDAGNFGDDVSVVRFGLALRRHGIPLSVYGLCEPYARRFGFERAAWSDELLSLIGTREGLDRLTREFPFPDVARLGRESLGHVDVLREALAEAVRPAPAAGHDEGDA